MSVEIRKVLKYPPEAFVSALPVDLVVGSNKVAEYSGFDPYILVIQGLSFSRTAGMRFTMNVDGYTDVVRLDDLASVKGLDYEEDVKVVTTKIATMLITSPSAITGFPWRHRVIVFKPTVAMKLQLGMRLTPDEEELATRYDVRTLLMLETPKPFNLSYGVEEWKTITVRLTSSGTVMRVSVPRNKKIILAGIAVERPPAPASAYLNVVRDNVDVLHLDLYCLPGLEYVAPVRIVSTDSIEASLDVRTAGEYKVRLVYGIGRLTLTEKVMWRLDLTTAERTLAETQNLFEKVLVGML